MNVNIRIPKGSLLYDALYIGAEYVVNEDITTRGTLSHRYPGFYHVIIDGYAYFVSMLVVEVLD